MKISIYLYLKMFPISGIQTVYWYMLLSQFTLLFPPATGYSQGLWPWETMTLARDFCFSRKKCPQSTNVSRAQIFSHCRSVLQLVEAIYCLYQGQSQICTSSDIFLPQHRSWSPPDCTHIHLLQLCRFELFLANLKVLYILGGRFLQNFISSRDGP